ncbi:pentapeptide repeat-containing protein [Henriciella sp. AS95]|uniref:pentapeptide repeat-containing protein n=1 Tax=Henriciella sp. AS95 TaxID=3135782 RepID=UPI00316E4757
MLKQIVIATAGLLISAGAFAQDASEIAKVQAGQSCVGCNLFQANLAYLDAKNVDVSGSRLRQSDMQLSTFDDWNLSGANLTIANMFGVRFNRSDFSGADLTRANMVGAYVGTSNFAGANLTDVNISGADLSIARGLTQHQLDRACGDNSTMLPKGLKVRPCA